MSTFSSRGLRLVQVARACALLPCVVMQAGLSAQQAQQAQHKPFIEPSESHERAKVKAVVEAAPAQHGRWDTLPYVMPINPGHAALMHDGKVLIIPGPGNGPGQKPLQRAALGPKTG